MAVEEQKSSILYQSLTAISIGFSDVFVEEGS